jgi:hypothetical protein
MQYNALSIYNTTDDMFRLTRNHHQANYSHSIQYILVCAYIMGSHIVYSDFFAHSPTRAMASSFTRFSRSHTHDAPQSVGLLWASDQFAAETST